MDVLSSGDARNRWEIALVTLPSMKKLHVFSESAFSDVHSRLRTSEYAFTYLGYLRLWSSRCIDAEILDPIPLTSLLIKLTPLTA